MADDPQIEGFDPAEVRAGLRLAMTVGMPTAESDQPTFYFADQITGDGGHALDSRGTPFAPDYRPTRVRAQGVRGPCSVEGEGGDSSDEMVYPEHVVLGLLDQDYDKVKGFARVVIGGVSYHYQRTEPPRGLVTVGVYRVHCLADDQG